MPQLLMIVIWEGFVFGRGFATPDLNVLAGNTFLMILFDWLDEQQDFDLP